MTPKQSDQVTTLIQRFKDVPGGLMPLLHAVQETIGHIPPESIKVIGKGMGLSRAEAYQATGW